MSTHADQPVQDTATGHGHTHVAGREQRRSHFNSRTTCQRHRRAAATRNTPRSQPTSPLHSQQGQPTGGSDMEMTSSLSAFIS